MQNADIDHMFFERRVVIYASECGASLFWEH